MVKHEFRWLTAAGKLATYAEVEAPAACSGSACRLHGSGCSATSYIHVHHTFCCRATHAQQQCLPNLAYLKVE
jgi:hypothetical protein